MSFWKFPVNWIYSYIEVLRDVDRGSGPRGWEIDRKMSDKILDEIFSRHYLLPELGREKQAMLLRSHVAIVGVGAVGGRTAEILVRAGIGTLTIIDSDIVEFSNLQRQTLYTWGDAEKRTEKPETFRRRLNEIMPTCRIFPKYARLTEENVGGLFKGADIVADGTDNIKTRYIVNDWCVRNGVPYIYAGAVGTRASIFPVLGKHGCLRCVLPVPPDPSALPTAGDVGIIAAAPAVAAARSSTLVLRLLTGDIPEPRWETYDVWHGTHSSMSLEMLKKHHGSEKCELCDNL